MKCGTNVGWTPTASGGYDFRFHETVDDSEAPTYETARARDLERGRRS